jgi:hypothetical protein
VAASSSWFSKELSLLILVVVVPFLLPWSAMPLLTLQLILHHQQQQQLQQLHSIIRNFLSFPAPPSLHMRGENTNN